MSEAKLKSTKGTGLKILTSKQMLERLPIVLAQVKAQKKGKKKRYISPEERQQIIDERRLV